MDTSQSLLELVAAARVTAKVSEDRLSEILDLMAGQTATDAQIKDLNAATRALELTAVDIYSVFESRMQHHFKRGPFSRKLKTLLLASGKTDLADRIYQYYLAINVLKHGIGTSHRELLETPSPLFIVNHASGPVTDDPETPAGLVDITVPGFFSGLATAIQDATDFLESRQ